LQAELQKKQVEVNLEKDDVTKLLETIKEKSEIASVA